MTILTPKLDNGRLSVEWLMTPGHASAIKQRVSQLAESQMLLPRFFSPYSGPVEGGALKFTVASLADTFVSGDLEQRAPGEEYKQVDGVDPEPSLAEVQDWGGSFEILDEQIRRNDMDYLRMQTAALANSITRQLDMCALVALNPLADDNVIEGHNWDAIVRVGPESTLTPSSALPTADLSRAQLAADLQQLGYVHDTLVVHPNQAHALRVGYGDDLSTMLTSAGITELHSNVLVTPGEAYAVKRGAAGVVGYEEPLTVNVVRDEKRRKIDVIGFAVPAFAVNAESAVKKITGLAG